MKKKLCSLLLAMSILLGALPLTAGAAEVPDCVSGIIRNPLYESVPAPETDFEEEKTADSRLTAGTRAAVYVSESAAADQLREAMVARQTNVILYVVIDHFWANSSTDNWVSEVLLPTAYSQELAQGAYDGDYLQWSWYQCSWQLIEHRGTQYIIQLNMQYYTTAQEEAALDAYLTQWISQMGLLNMSEYDRCAAIYDDITGSVSYSFDGLERINNGSTSMRDYSIFTAYGAVFRGEAVCQGYSTLFYALCRKVNLPVRIITSETHAWNIVYLKGIWYNLDSTWDSQTFTGRSWFLLGSENFAHDGHESEPEFLTAAFQSAYPISTIDYDPFCPYNDVPRDSDHYYDILRATELGLFEGTSEYTFSPKMEMSRAMLVTVLWRLAGEPKVPGGSTFSDVAADAWYADAVSWAAANGIVYGVGGGRFDPDTVASREQLTTILFRYAEFAGEDVSFGVPLEEFTDSSSISDFAEEPMRWAVAVGIVRGTSDTTLSPLDTATREQLASMMIRFMNFYGL